MKPRSLKVLLSGVNLVDGGTLQVFRESIKAFSNRPNINVICLVHDQTLFDDLKYDNLEIVEFPNVKKSWLSRLFFEFYTSDKISKHFAPDIWVAMHDISPRLSISNQFVYCHNPSPFYKAGFIDFKYNWKFFLFTFFYKYLYRMNIRSNKAVIVQQSWISDYFLDELEARKVIVAKPKFNNVKSPVINSYKNSSNLGAKTHLFYPALSRTFKNFELILNALDYLKDNNPSVYACLSLDLTLTPEGSRFEGYLYNKYKHLDNVQFLGMLSKEEVNAKYKECDAVIFPSKLETWGLPISEATEHGKPIFLADLPYAHETLGDYDAVCFVDPDDYINLAEKLEDFVEGRKVFYKTQFIDTVNPCHGWDQLVDRILELSK